MTIAMVLCTGASLINVSASSATPGTNVQPEIDTKTDETFHKPLSAEETADTSEQDLPKLRLRPVLKPPTKSEILGTISDDVDLTRREVSAVFGALANLIRKNLISGDPSHFILADLFSVKRVVKLPTKARKGVNPDTGEEMIFKAKPGRVTVKCFLADRLVDHILGTSSEPAHTESSGAHVEAEVPPIERQVLSYIPAVTGLEPEEVNSVFDSLAELMVESLGRGGPGIFSMPGLMKLKVVRKPATRERVGVDPFTGEKTVFKAKPARTSVKCQPLKGLKDMTPSFDRVIRDMAPP